MIQQFQSWIAIQRKQKQQLEKKYVSPMLTVALITIAKI